MLSTKIAFKIGIVTAVVCVVKSVTVGLVGFVVIAVLVADVDVVVNVSLDVVVVVDVVVVIVVDIDAVVDVVVGIGVLVDSVESVALEIVMDVAVDVVSEDVCSHKK